MPNEDILLFFSKKPAALPLYEAFSSKVLAAFSDVEIRVQKTQISFYNRHLFAAASLLRARRAAALPNPYLTVTFGLGYRQLSPRIAAAVEIRPNRWTHHVVLGSPDEIDAELMGWLKQAYLLAQAKR